MVMIKSLEKQLEKQHKIIEEQDKEIVELLAENEVN